MNNIPYSSPKRSIAPKTSRGESSRKYKTVPSLTAPLSQTNLFVLIIRQIFNSKLLSSFNAIRNKPKKRFHILSIINQITKKRMIFGFEMIGSYGRKVKIQQLRNQLTRVNYQLYLIRISHKLVHKTLYFGFYKIFANKYKRNVDLYKLQQSIATISSAYQKTNKKKFLKQLTRISKLRKLQKISIKPLYLILNEVLKKNIKYSFHLLVIFFYQKQYQQLYGISQKRRKQFYQFQNNQSKQLSKQQQYVQKLKQKIDRQTNQVNKKASQLRQQKAIKANQIRLKMQALEKDYEKAQREYKKVQNHQQKYDQIMQKRIKLSLDSKGGQQKVRGYFNQLKFEIDQGKDIKSSIFLNKIVFIKDKFKNILAQDFQKFRRQCQDFQIFANTIQRNIICMYQSVTSQQRPQSQQYNNAAQQNFNLKQSVSSLLRFHLLMGQGDKNLQQSAQNLENLFEDMFLFLEEKGNQKKQKQQFGKTSFFSSLSSKSLKMNNKTANKAATKSNKSFK